MPQDEFIDDIPFPETQNYVKRILGTAEDYRSTCMFAEVLHEVATEILHEGSSVAVICTEVPHGCDSF